MNIPKNFQLCYSKEEIANAVKRIGDEISKWSQQGDGTTDILAVPILRGGIFFFADLVRAINCSVEISPIQSAAYVGNATPRPEIQVFNSIFPFKGRRVLLVDDICDSGRTLQWLKEKLLDEGALEVRSAVLIRRSLESETFLPDWIGFSYKGSEWFVGYGMDDSERWRNLESVYIIRK